MASSSDHGGEAASTGFDASVPPLPADATPDQKDAHWVRHVYQGDSMAQLTFRAVVMGGLLGMLMAASNLYTTLAIGWGFGVAITACVMSYVIWNVVTLLAGHMVMRLGMAVLGLAVAVMAWVLVAPGIEGAVAKNASLAEWAKPAGMGAAGLISLGALAVVVLFWAKRSKMSMLENNCMQSTAAAAGSSTGATIATMFGALILLREPAAGQTTKDIASWDVTPWYWVTLFTAGTAMLGCFLAVPLKKTMINHEQLRFPSGIAAAETLRSLYSQGREALEKAYALLTGLLIGLIVGVFNTAEGSLRILDEYVFKYVPRLPEAFPPSGTFMTVHGKVPGGFALDYSLLLVAAGVITRLRVCISMFLGSALLYFVVGPYLVGLDQANPASGWFQDAKGVWQWEAARHLKEYAINIELPGGGKGLAFTRWALWGGTALMVAASLTNLAMQWKTIARAFTSFLSPSARHTAADADVREKLDRIEVPMSWMVMGLVPITILLVVVQQYGFEISWWAGLLAIAMSFILSLVACRSTGETDTNPIGAMGKVMQLTFAVIKPGKVIPNLASAGVAANSAAAAADLLTDLKSGYLLGANPRKQFIAQFCGVFFGTLAIIPAWFLMIPNKEALEKYALPATQQWAAVARVLTQGIDKLPQSCLYAMAIGGALGILLPVIDRLASPKIRPYLPSAMGLGLSWVIPFGNAASFLLGAIIGWIWEKADRKSSDKFAIAIASGLIAGESLMKAILAMLATALGIAGLN